MRFSSIGDIVLTSPIIRALKTQLEGEVQIDFITKSKFATLLEYNPHLNEVITIEEKVSEVQDQLRDGMYDYVIDLHNNIRSRQVKKVCRALAFTLDKRNIAKWLYVRAKREVQPIGHVVSRSFDAVTSLGVQDDGKGLDYFIPAQQEVSLNVLPAPFQNGYIVYAIGGQMMGKILPSQQMIELCTRISIPIVLLGGVEDRECGDQVVKACGDRVFNACGAFSLHQSASLMQQAQKVISHDTGLMHIATALGRPVISLWFATTPALGFSPWQAVEGSRMIEADCPKRPTSKLGNRGYEDGCVFNLDLESVVRAVAE
ncbi:MAG: glycosyltransferase family 9 protein [Flavobacteriales bacterium]|nr:glycosyltransferase family 9 protein [Flavobacteriales bacterium]